MASYQARHRDPLLDRNTQAIIERRGKELFGGALLALAVATILMLASYSPDDPSWMSVTDEPARNLLGRFGASLASPLHIIVGLAGWGFALMFLVWGIRFVTHEGEDRAINRLVFAPIAVALAAVYASTHVPGAGWTHSFGLGGLFGDTVLGALLGVVPVQATFGLRVVALIMAAAALAMSLYVLGFTRAELRRIGRFLLVGIIMTYALVLRLGGRGALAAIYAARAANERRKDSRLNREEAQPAVANTHARTTHPLVTRPQRQLSESLRPEPVLRAERAAEFPASRPADDLNTVPKQGILSKIPSLLRRAPVPDETVEPMLAMQNDFGDPRIKAKIADVLRNRVRQKPVLVAQPRQEPPVVNHHPRGPQPMVLRKADPLPLTDSIDFSDDNDVDLYEDTTIAYTADENRVPPLHDPKKVVQHAARKPVQPSRQARQEAQPALNFDGGEHTYETPPLSLLTSAAAVERHHLSEESLEENARMLESVLDDYGVKGEIVSVRPGPVVTMYELEPAPGLKASRVIGLADDIARSMSALSARVSTVPGRSVIGIELPNVNREKVVLREILASRDFGDSNMRLPLALGKDIAGDPIVANLSKMPHLLIAGTTGSGKSVAINTMILSLLYKLTPDECRLIMIDPKMLELSVYDGIPHLLSPVVTDPKKAVVALKWVVGEMEDRYRKMSKMGVRNIEGFNGRVREALNKDELFKRTVQTGFDDETGEPIFETEEFKPETIPYIVVIVDEMADLMMVAGKEIEACIQRLAQMARASGIHLIMATQRPSVDVITGTIKANFPTRISFQVTSKIDSRTILGEQGAEQLLGMGDMLYMAGGSRITRVHGPFVSDEEVEEIVNFLKSFGPPEYMSGVTDGPDEDTESSIDLVLGLGGNTDGEDALYDQAVQIVLKDRKCSTSYIQRKLAIGYNKAARLVEQMEDNSLVSSANHVGKREILVPEQ